MSRKLYVNIAVKDLAHRSRSSRGYVASFHDPDGHLWEVMWMDQAGLPQ